MAGLHLTLFGEYKISYSGELVTSIRKIRVQELLAWLLLNRKTPQSRQYIAFQFWPECSEKQALTNLRNALYYLRKNLPDADNYILADSNSLFWNSRSDFYLDVADFENSLRTADEATSVITS
ncbi:hypothetical protein BH23BAC3_BH23BAC3_26170 [soil metagenome]